MEQISQLKALVEAKIDYHQQTLHILDGLKSQLEMRVKQATEHERMDHIPKPVINERNSRAQYVLCCKLKCKKNW